MGGDTVCGLELLKQEALERLNAELSRDEHDADAIDSMIRTCHITAMHTPERRRLISRCVYLLLQYSDMQLEAAEKLIADSRGLTAAELLHAHEILFDHD